MHMRHEVFWSPPNVIKQHYVLWIYRIVTMLITNPKMLRPNLWVPEGTQHCIHESNFQAQKNSVQLKRKSQAHIHAPGQMLSRQNEKTQLKLSTYHLPPTSSHLPPDTHYLLIIEQKHRNNSFINWVLMVYGSWLKDGWGPLQAPGPPPPTPPPLVEPLTIIIDKLNN